MGGRRAGESRVPSECETKTLTCLCLLGVECKDQLDTIWDYINNLQTRTHLRVYPKHSILFFYEWRQFKKNKTIVFYN